MPRPSRPAAPAAGGPGVPHTARRVVLEPFRRNRGLLTSAYVLTVLWQLGEAAVPVMIGVVVDQGIATGDLGPFLLSCLGLGLVFLVFSLSYRFGGRMALRVQQAESHRLRLEAAGHVLDPRGVRDEQLSGETLSLATSDADKVTMLVRQLGYTIASLVTVVVTAVYLVGVDVTLALVVLLGLPVTIALTQAVSPVVARRTEREQAAVARVAGLAGDLVAGVRPIKGIGAEDVASHRYRTSSRAAQRSAVVTARSWGYLSGLTTFIAGAFLALVAWLAGSKALDGDLSLGQLVAVVGLTQFLAEPIKHLGDLSAQAASSWASARRIAAFLSTERDLVDGTVADVPERPRVELAGVTHGRLRDVSLSTSDGELLALAVDDPAAAAALVALLGGDVVPDSGEVRVGGTPAHALTIDARRRSVLVVPHAAYLPEGTLRSVVDPLGRLGADELDAVLAASAAEDVVALHDTGLDHAVRARGASLSGGQRQRLALARALAATPAVLVLHDPTSAVDAVTEQRVAAGLSALRRGHGATVVVTSSPALLAAADRVVWVRDGRVAAEASHATLLAEPDYREAVLR
ncbi:ABC transporter ATP-binding protein [Aeromicrobium sp. IC_218]|uniref:ABC transporter transmembrane domain-containing protein n=1 Tax=Aeromicrobium sp. IC_218 TaxID=2545468 RepID=UPI00103AA7D5|nr:ABC transporter ATP-binding protein [Aeromicrobium sp. IC_218]TCI97536.1 ABC transporter ATP-binding protein [Aeromicrobium sp. IC_218]